MRTIKIKQSSGAIITKEGLISCLCCCFCESYDIDDLLYSGKKPPLYGDEMAYECGDLEAHEALIDGDDRPWESQEACIRWLCRRTVLLEGGGYATISTAIGATTTNELDLNGLVLECLGERNDKEGLANGSDGVDPEEYNKCYLYSFNFYGWYLRPRGGDDGWDYAWISDDNKFDLYRTDEPI